MSDPWVCHWVAGKSVWQKRTVFLDLIRNLILSLINPSQQMFDWHSSILNNCNNNKVSYLLLGKKRPSPSPNSRLTEWVGALVGWFLFHFAFSSQRYNWEDLGMLPIFQAWVRCTFTPYWVWCVSVWGRAQVCCPPQQGNQTPCCQQPLSGVPLDNRETLGTAGKIYTSTNPGDYQQRLVSILEAWLICVMQMELE